MAGASSTADPLKLAGDGPLFAILVGSLEEEHMARATFAPLGELCAPVLGFPPRIEIVALSHDGSPHPDAHTLPNVEACIDAAAAGGLGPVFLLPAVLDLRLAFKQGIGATMREVQRRHPELQVHCDDVDPAHPLLLHAFVDAAAECLGRMSRPRPGRTGVLLVADGEGDPACRSRSYLLMRLLWEQLGALRGEVAFLRHAHTALPEQLSACAATALDWVLIPQFLWSCEHMEYARVIADDFAKRQDSPEPWPMAAPIGAHPNIVGWLQQRIVQAWEAHRRARTGRIPSARRVPRRRSRLCGPSGETGLAELAPPIPESFRYGDGVIADVSDGRDLAPLLAAYGVGREPCFVKVTWHGYATGTYTDPVALDALLAALPCRAVIVEGHTAGRNTGGASFDWETDSREHRSWIRAQEQDYLERTGLAEVLERHRATYLNVTEAWWDGACADPAAVHQRLAERGVTLHYDELAEYVPSVFLEHGGAPFLSFARFKGPTRLTLSNLFGLIPVPLRSAWHGPNITHFARVCCDLARLYGSLFDLHGLVEGLNVAVRWDRKGLYRSRWGNYDLIHDPGLATMSRGVATADALGSRLQGQDIARSAFFDVVNHELGIAEAAIVDPIDPKLIRRLV